MKRILALGVALALLFSVGAFAQTIAFPAGPATPAENGLSQDDAVTIARSEMARRENLPLAEVDMYRAKAGYVTLESGEEAWVVLLDCEVNGTDALVTLSASGTEVIDYCATHEEILTVVYKQWTQKKGAIRTWSIEDQALLNWLFGAADAYVVPDESCISQEAARDIALAALPQAVSSPEFAYGFKRMSYPDGAQDQLVWLVTIYEKGKERYVVHISAIDGVVIECIKIGNFG